jgi:diguanylate cyclase (GGDEF)-like protein
MEINDEFLCNLLNVFKNKFELVLKITKEKDTKYKVLGECINNKREKIYPSENEGLYLEYLNQYIFKYILIESDIEKTKFYFENIYRFLDKDYEYSFDCDFILNKERLCKRFSFFKESDTSFLMLVEDYTRYRLESFLNTVRITNAKSVLYEIKNDKLNYHAIFVSKEFAELVNLSSEEVLKILKKHHPFDFIDCEDINKILLTVAGNEKNGFHTAFIFKMNTSKGILNIKVDITYIQLGKKLFAYCIFNDISDVLKLNELNLVLENTKKQAKELEVANKTDPLTGLGNEAKYKIITKNLDLEIKNGFKDFAVCVCDVNGVKVTNDTYGHQFGCNLIVTAGHTFPNYFKTSEIFHIGGDEYVIIVTGQDYKNLDDILRRIRNILDYQYMEYEGIKLRLSVAIGCSKFKDGDKCYHDAFQRADDDMYKRKIEIKTKHGIPMR